MDTNEVEQPEVETEERKPLGKWWYGAIAGGLTGTALGILWVYRAGDLYHWENVICGITIPLFPGMVVGGLAVRWVNRKRWGVIGSVILGALATIITHFIGVFLFFIFVFFMGWN